MATFTSTACQTSASGFFLNPPKYIENGVIARSAIFTFGLAQSAGDVIQMVPVPKGAVVHDVIPVFLPGATANVTYGVGDGGSAGRYLNSFSTSGNGAVARLLTAGLGYSYSAEDTIDITIQTAGSASAGGTVRLTVLYSMDQATDGSS